MDFREFIQQFAERFGIQMPEIVDEAAAFDADGMPFFMMRVVSEGEGDYLVVAADLGEPPPERLEGLYKTLLAANYLFSGTGGATLSLDGDRIMVCRSLPIAIMDGDSFYAEVEKFVNTAETWRKIVVDYRDAAALTPAADAAESPSFPSGGFMQV